MGWVRSSSRTGENNKRELLFFRTAGQEKRLKVRWVDNQLLFPLGMGDWCVIWSIFGAAAPNLIFVFDLIAFFFLPSQTPPWLWLLQPGTLTNPQATSLLLELNKNEHYSAESQPSKAWWIHQCTSITTLFVSSQSTSTVCDDPCCVVGWKKRSSSNQTKNQGLAPTNNQIQCRNVLKGTLAFTEASWCLQLWACGGDLNTVLCSYRSPNDCELFCEEFNPQKANSVYYYCMQAFLAGIQSPNAK